MLEQFGIWINGWSEGNRHYIAVFVCYYKEDIAEIPLLAITSLFNEENYDAASYMAFIGDVLKLFRKNLKNLIFLIGDNAPVNKSLVDLLNVPFIGCANHHINLAYKLFLEPHKSLFQRMERLIVILRNIKQT